MLKVSRGGYYAYLSRPMSATRIAHEALKPFVKDVFDNHLGRYGSKRITVELNRQGLSVSRRRVVRAMQELGLCAKGSTKRYRRHKPVDDKGDNLLARDFNGHARNSVWVGDITYLSTREGWLYLAVWLDLFSRKVVGWSTSSRINEDLVISSLRQAVARETPAASLTVHTDRGSQYTSAAFRRELTSNGFIQSLSRKGNPYDNAVMESFYRTLKRELPVSGKFNDRITARQEVFEFIEMYYNTRRAHSSIGNISPVAYERAQEQKLDS